MHERSLVMALLRQVDELRRAQGGQRVVLVRVSVGEFSGVEPELLRMAFQDVLALECGQWAGSVEANQDSRGGDLEIEPFPAANRARLRQILDPVVWRDARLEMECVPLEAGCQGCGAEFAVERFRFICPKCGSGALDILRGEGLVLQSVTMEFDES
jgi:Zn finger protein HypA/HybF involved in hydrogenase expression